MAKPILSIVIPTFNVEKYLERCLNSLVLDKTIATKIEVIVVNDGGEDNSIAIANDFKKRFPNTIKIIDKQNGGHGSTINAGTAVASGKYFKVLDSDDWFNIDNLPAFIEYLSDATSDIVLTNYTRELVYDGVADEFIFKSIEPKTVYNLDSCDLSIFNNDYMFMHTITMRTDKYLTSKVALSEHTFYVDMEFIILPLTKLTTFSYLPVDIYHYWIGRPGQSMNIKNMFKNRLHHERVLKRLITFLNTGDISDNKRRYIYNILKLMTNTHYLIYINNNLSTSQAREILRLDKWLKDSNPSIYDDTGEEFMYIKHARKTSFMPNIISDKYFRKASFIAHKISKGGKR